MLPSSSSSPTGTISPALFNRYTAKWLTLVSAADSTELAQSFVAGEVRLKQVRFSIKQMIGLLSSVGVEQVKARFLVTGGEREEEGKGEASLQFSLALYAADACGQRLSAYYLAEEVVTEGPASVALDGGIPGPLARVWLGQWESVSQITPNLFLTREEPLRGYNFGVKDFLAPLFNQESFEALELRLSFGLSAYQAADSHEEVPTQTFGLLLQVYNKQTSKGSGYFDMAAPCPPGT